MTFRKNLNYLILILFTPSTNKCRKPFLRHKSFLIPLIIEDHQAVQRREVYQDAQRREDHQAAQL